jgi:predicted nucleotidyltransferase
MDPEKFARDATVDDLQRVIHALNDAGVEYFLIGGYALAAWGHQRATRDIDILVLDGLLLTKQTVRGKDEAGRIFIETALRMRNGSHE